MSSPELPPGLWSAELQSPGGPLPFGLALEQGADGWSAWFVNGEERIAVPVVRWEGRRLTLEITHYDSRIGASLHEVDGALRLDGMWTKRTGRDDFARLVFRAHPPAAPVDVLEDPEEVPPADVSGRWRVAFESDSQPAVGLFEQTGLSLRGTFLTTTGDYRYLAGGLDEGVYRLSCFDGAHAFLFEARLQDDGSLLGDFWSRDVWHESWTATRDEGIRLPDGFQLTQWTGAAPLADLHYPDVTGVVRTLDDPAFAGRARILQVFGSWCPNCHDASEYMVELNERYGPQGLSVLGLAFEVTGDFRRDAEHVLAYAERHGVSYPLLVAGLSDKAEASKRFPLLDQVRSYPTTIFLHADGGIRAVYQGFSGPATGEAHAVLRASFEAIIEELLAESAPASDVLPQDG